MANCSGIFQGQDIDCLNPLAVGLEQRLFLANVADVSAITFSVVAGEENVITGITMKTDKAFYEFAGVAQSIKAQSELVRTDISVSYKHTVDLSVFEVDNVSLNNMMAMAFKNQIAITLGPNDSSLGNGAITVSGPSIGMRLLTNIRINSSNDTGGAHVMQLATPDQGGTEGEIPNPFFVTDYATTLLAVEALLIPAV